MAKGARRGINDICKLPEFEELRKSTLGNEDRCSLWGRPWNNGAGISSFVFCSWAEVIIVSAQRRVAVEEKPLRVDRYCRSGSNSDVLLKKVLEILKRHDVPYVIR